MSQIFIFRFTYLTKYILTEVSVHPAELRAFLWRRGEFSQKLWLMLVITLLILPVMMLLWGIVEFRLWKEVIVNVCPGVHVYLGCYDRIESCWNQNDLLPPKQVLSDDIYCQSHLTISGSPEIYVLVHKVAIIWIESTYICNGTPHTVRKAKWNTGYS